MSTNLLISALLSWPLFLYPPMCIVMSFMFISHVAFIPVFRRPITSVGNTIFIICLAVCIIACCLLNIILHLLGSMSSYIWFIVAPIGVLIIYPDISNPYRILNFSIGIFLIIFIMSISLWLINLFKYNAPEWFNSQLRYDDSLRFRISDIWPIISGTVLIFYFVTYNNKLTIAIQNGMATAAATVAQSASAPDTIADMSKYDDLYQNIIRYFEKDRPYLDSGFNIAQLCSVLNTNTAYIYRAIKHNRNMTFSAFVALYRIEHVKDILRNNSDMYTIEYTYSSSGFSSQSTFNKTFKLIEGCTPSEYIESVKK